MSKEEFKALRKGSRVSGERSSLVGTVEKVIRARGLESVWVRWDNGSRHNHHPMSLVPVKRRTP